MLDRDRDGAAKDTTTTETIARVVVKIDQRLRSCLSLELFMRAVLFGLVIILVFAATRAGALSNDDPAPNLIQKFR